MSLFSLAVPTSTKSSPEHFFKSLHGLLRPVRHRAIQGQPHLSLELSGTNNSTRFMVYVEPAQEPFIKDLLVASYPGLEMTPAEDPLASLQGHVLHAYVRLHKRTFLPIRTDFAEAEPLAALLETLGRPAEGETIHLSVLIRPRAHGWQAGARRYARELKRGYTGHWSELFRPSTAKKQPTPYLSDLAKRVEEKADEMGFETLIRVVVAAKSEDQAREYLRAVSASLRPFSAENSFDVKDATNPRFLDDMQARVFSSPTKKLNPYFGSFMLNVSELSALYRIPEKTPPHVLSVKSPKLATPKEVPSDGAVVGTSNYPGQERPVAIPRPDRRRHLHIGGGTGAGKTTLQANLALQSIREGVGVGIIDPKGDLSDAVLGRYPEERLDDLIYISADETDRVITYNPFEWKNEVDRDLQGEDIRSVFEHLAGKFWGPKSDELIRVCVSTLLSRPDSSLAFIRPLLTDRRFRKRMLEELHDPLGVGGFWLQFEGLTAYQRNEHIMPLLNKTSAITMRPKLRRVLCSQRSTIDLEDVVDSGKVLIANLSTGTWGEGGSQLAGSFLFARLWQAIRKRARIPEEQRRDFELFIDEFQMYVASASRNFSDTLSLARSFRLSLTLANQFLGQLPEELKEALSANARSRLTFATNQEDARYLSKEFPGFEPEAFISLPRYSIVAKLSVNGETVGPLTATTLPLEGEADRAWAEHVASRSRELYGRPVHEIDRELEEVLNPPQYPEEPRKRAGRVVS